MVDLKAIKKGDILEHKLSKDWVMVLEVTGSKKITSRTKSLDIKDFYDFELQYKK